VLAWLVLTRLVFPLPATTPFSGKDFIKGEIEKLGPMAVEEKRVGSVFALAAILWMTRKDRLFGAEVDVFGWSHYLDQLLLSAGSSPVGYLIDDGTVASKLVAGCWIGRTQRKFHGGFCFYSAVVSL
jgi:di/tricarboxylate transporter